MQITSNTTGMEAELCLSPDTDGREFCVVVLKGTFDVNEQGDLTLSNEQVPFVYADVHYGDPGDSSIEYECDFARTKPNADVLVHGSAYAPDGQPVTELDVALDVDGRTKIIHVVGDRKWQSGIAGYHATLAEPFLEMPLQFERAFGGSDHSHANEKHHGSEVRNLCGRGYRRNGDAVAGTSLPNLECPDHSMKKWSDTPPPVGFGSIGRNWAPRSKFAGTYDEEWMENRSPFLPKDFDERYFQSAPEDQWFPHFKGGEVIQCTNMSPDQSVFRASLPTSAFPVLYRFRRMEVSAEPLLDTVTLEPDRKRVILCWRASVPVGPKPHALQEIIVGEPRVTLTASGKPHYRSIAEAIEAEWN